MDSTSPDLHELQQLCNQHHATLLVDVAHDLGCLGTRGSGVLELQGMLGKVDLVMGSFSKSFCSNGGFVCCNSKALKHYVQAYSGPQTFSNAMSPVQTATVLRAMDIVRSADGLALRTQLMENIRYMRGQLTRVGFTVLGSDSPVVPVLLGAEGLVRLSARLLFNQGFMVNPVEFPGCAKGAARLRVQMMTKHTTEQIDSFVRVLVVTVEEARALVASDSFVGMSRSFSSKL